MKKVLLLFGGNSLEHEVSCNSAKSILKNYDKTKFIFIPVFIDKNNNWFIYTGDIDSITNIDKSNLIQIDNIIEYLKKYDLVFSIIHGFGGEDGKLQGMLDLFNIKYVGSNSLVSAIGMDKEISKILFTYLGIPVTPYMVVENLKNIQEIERFFNYPIIIKPCNGGSSIGLSKANNKKELKEGIIKALKYDNKVLIEKYIKGRELECAVLEHKKLIISDIGEILKDTELYDYESKYVKKIDTTIPTDIPKNIKRQIQDYSKKVFEFLKCKDLARIDFFYDEESNKIYLNEINTLPGFTEISMYPKLIMNKKISYKDLITYLIQK